MSRNERWSAIACAAVALYALALLLFVGDAPLALVATLPLCVPLAIALLARQRDTRRYALVLLALLWVSGTLIMLRSFLAFGGDGHLAVLFLPLVSIVLLVGAMVGWGLLAGAVLLVWEVARRCRRRAGRPAD
jgi:hypothetical protein